MRTPDEWARRFGIRVHDPDGWRGVHRDKLGVLEPKPYDEPISEEEFGRRVILSTITLLPKCSRERCC